MGKCWGSASIHLKMMEFDNIFYEILGLIETKIVQKPSSL